MEDDDDEEDLEVRVDGERHANEDGVQEDTELEDEDTRNLSERAVVENTRRLNASNCHTAWSKLLLEVRVIVWPLLCGLSMLV